MTIAERFLKYVSFDTTANEKSNTTPSSEGQLVFAQYLIEELTQIGLQEISLDQNGYIMATLPANCEKEIPTIGFIAHMDTSPETTGKNVNPQIVYNYAGDDIILNEEKNIILTTKKFPEIKNYIGQDIITTNGTTLLGADDKAGITAIISAMEYLMQHPEIEHGTIKIGFTPDEEIGQGADHFDVEKFGASWAYTIDGGEIGELEYENFNAASAQISIKGINIHPGYAYNKMINSLLVAHELIAMLPQNERPETTRKYEGFYHLIHMEGSVEETKLTYIIRNHDRNLFEQKKQTLTELIQSLNKKYGYEIATIALKDQYYNMKEKIEPMMYIVDLAFEAMTNAGVTPLVKPIRGGTDGARLSFEGLPCPNIFAGGHNFHGPYEYVPIPSMEKAMQVIVNIAHLTTKYSIPAI